MNFSAKRWLGPHSETPVQTGPGGWVALDPRSGRVMANLMLRLHHGQPEPGILRELSAISPPEVQVRLGFLARSASREGLDAWVTTHPTHPLWRVAQDSAKHYAKEGLRQVHQYVWLTMPVSPELAPYEIPGLLDDLERCAQILTNQLGVYGLPAEEWREVADTYEPVEAAQQLSLAACSFFPVQPDVISYLQNNNGSQADASFVVPDMLKLPHPSFTVWVTVAIPSAAEARSPVRGLRRLAKLLCGGGKAGEGPSGDRGHPLRCQYQLTLHHCSERARQQAGAALLLRGLDFRELTTNLLGHSVTRKSFLVDPSEVAGCCPLQAIADARLDHGGLLLRTEAGTPMVFDPFVSTSGGSHVLVTGGAAVGKDFMCRSLLSAHVAQGQPAWMLAGGDSAESATPLVEMLSGRKTVLQLTGSGLNPLGMCQSADDANILKPWVTMLVVDAMGSTLDDHSQRLLNEALDRAWLRSHEGALSLETLKQELEHVADARAARLAQALESYTGQGAYASLFSGEPLDLDTESLLLLDTTAFADEKEVVLSLTLLTMLNLHWQHLKTAKRKMVYVASGEAWPRYETSSVESAELLQTFLRQARGQNGAFVTWMHYRDIVEWRDGSVTRAIADYARWHVLMQVPPEVLPWSDLQRKLGYSERAFNLWRQAYSRRAQLAKFVLVTENGSHLLSLIPGPRHLAMHATDRRMVEAYKAARQQGLSVVNALDAVAKGP